MANMSREELAVQTGINERDLLAINLLERTTVPDPQTKKCPQLTSEETALLTDFLERSVGNMKLNQQILAMQKSFKPQDTGIGFTVIDILKNITYKTRHWTDDHINIDTLYDRFNRSHQGEQLKEEDKITLAQYGALSDLASTFVSLTVLYQAGILPTGGLLSLYEKAQKANEMVRNLQESFFRDFKMRQTAVVTEDKTRKTQPAEKSMSITQQLVGINGGHTAVGFSPFQGHSMFSHSNTSHAKAIFSLKEFLYNDVYRIKLDKFIAPKMQGYLKQHLGDNWLPQVERMFGEIQRDLHDSHLMSPIAAKLRFHSASITDWYGAWRHSLTGTNHLPVPHSTFFEPDDNNREVRDMIFARKQFNEQENAPIKVLCSQFVGISLITTLKELNDRIAKEVMAKGEDKENVPDIIIQLPIEMLGRLSLRRLIEILDEHDALEKVEAPEEGISSIITTREESGGMRDVRDGSASDDDDMPHL